MTKLLSAAALFCLMAGSFALASEPVVTTAPASVAPAPIVNKGPDSRCGNRTLTVCTRERIAALQQLSRSFKRAAARQPDKKPQTVSDQNALESYNRWLYATSAEAGNLAVEGQRALGQPNMQMSFNLQCLALQEKMQRENLSYTSVSNVLKTRHDTAKNAISNVR